MSKLLLFDCDGTLASPGEKIDDTTLDLLLKLKKKYQLGIISGSPKEKIESQTRYLPFHHLFPECGSIYYQLNNNNNYKEIYRKNIRNHPIFPQLNIFIKISLHFLSQVNYPISGHIIDIRNSLIYISLIGQQASKEERNEFIKNHSSLRTNLLELLNKKVKELELEEKISIKEGGAVGIAIYPTEWDKIQVLDVLEKQNFEKIYYFGDKYLENGNDFKIINDPRVIGIKVDNNISNHLLKLE